MIICSCNVLSRKDVFSAIEQGRLAKTQQVYVYLGHRPRCGRCIPSIRKILDEARVRLA